MSVSDSLCHIRNKCQTGTTGDNIKMNNICLRCLTKNWFQF